MSSGEDHNASEGASRGPSPSAQAFADEMTMTHEAQRVSDPGEEAAGHEEAPAEDGGADTVEVSAPEGDLFLPTAVTRAPNFAAEDGVERTEPALDVDQVNLGLHWFGLSDVGLVRDHNEDAFSVCSISRAELDEAPALQSPACGMNASSSGMVEVDDRGVVLAVYDGMGGAAAGEVASHMAAETLLKSMVSAEGDTSSRDFADSLVGALHEAGENIFDEASRNRSRQGMGTTATVAGLRSEELVVGQVGDSRAYLLRGGVLTQLTKDQTLVNQLLEVGQLSEEEAETFEHSNIILQALGTAQEVQVDVSSITLRRYDRLLLCSDGLSGMVDEDTVRDIMVRETNLSECAHQLVEAAKAGGGEDNVTVVVADFVGSFLEEAKVDDIVAYVRHPSSDRSTFFGDRLEETSSSLVAPAEGPQDDATEAKVVVDVPRASGRRPVRWLLASVVVVGLGFLAYAAAERVLTSTATEVALKDRPPPSVSTQPPSVDTSLAAVDATSELANEVVEEVPLTEVILNTSVTSGSVFIDGEELAELPLEAGQTLLIEEGQHAFEVRVGKRTVAQTEVSIEGSKQSVDLRLLQNLHGAQVSSSRLDRRRAAASARSMPGPARPAVPAEPTILSSAEASSEETSSEETSASEAESADEGSVENAADASKDSEGPSRSTEAEDDEPPLRRDQFRLQ